MKELTLCCEHCNQETQDIDLYDIEEEIVCYKCLCELFNKDEDVTAVRLCKE